jgi:anti-sigma factor RsiW
LPHISSNDLELYALGRLGPAHEAEIEEHLLICEDCRNRLTEEDATIDAIRKTFRFAAVPDEYGSVN